MPERVRLRDPENDDQGPADDRGEADQPLLRQGQHGAASSTALPGFGKGLRLVWQVRTGITRPIGAPAPIPKPAGKPMLVASASPLPATLMSSLVRGDPVDDRVDVREQRVERGDGRVDRRGRPDCVVFSTGLVNAVIRLVSRSQRRAEAEQRVDVGQRRVEPADDRRELARGRVEVGEQPVGDRRRLQELVLERRQIADRLGELGPAPGDARRRRRRRRRPSRRRRRAARPPGRSPSSPRRRSPRAIAPGSLLTAVELGVRGASPSARRWRSAWFSPSPRPAMPKPRLTVVFCRSSRVFSSKSCTTSSRSTPEVTSRCAIVPPFGIGSAVSPGKSSR